MSDAFIRFENVKKVYQAGEVAVTALHDVSFEVEKGEICVIVGESGAGKTTLLNILGGMDDLTEGCITVDDADLSRFSKKELTSYRRTDVGFVFQFYNLIPNLTALENVEIAAKLSKTALPAEEVLEQVGLKERAGNFPAQLSGGEQQRVAIARALAKNPGHQPPAGHDRDHHYPQQSALRDGRPCDPRAKRNDPVCDQK